MRFPRHRAAAAVVVVLALAGCARDAARPADPAPVLSHVHGLGVNPADGALYVATHHGLYRVGAGGRPEEVGDVRDDTMGFTVAGPDRFLASGHPSRPGEPPLLGLVESTDAGRTWRTVSLKGEADFHALVAAHGRVYGWNTATGELMVSADGGTTWQRRSKLALPSFAVDPADPDHLLGTSDRGPVASRDGGRTWRAAPASGPALLAWDRDGGLWSARLDGTVAASTDAGASWAERGTLPGRPAALLATKDAVYAATTDARIVRSSDGGRTWTVLYEPRG